MTVQSSEFSTRHRLVITVALVILLASTYMLTYSANLIANDELEMLDLTGSLVDFGDLRYDLAFWYGPPAIFDTTLRYPLRDTVIDPLQMIAASPLYWIAEHVPGVGIIHTVWLLNIGLCAAACALFYWYALTLGYDDRTALLASLALGLLTVVWVYSKLFFREPLALFLLLLTAFLLEHWRKQWHKEQFLRAAILLAAACLTAWLVTLSKGALMAALPGLVILGLPDFGERFKNKAVHRGLTILLLILLIAPAIIVVFDLISVFAPIDSVTIRGFGIDTTYTRTALHTYLFSIGGSMWGTSPILLLALPGGWILWKQRKYRVVMGVVVILLGVAFGYALLRTSAWFGGKSWPLRFLVPLIPFPLLLALPVFQQLTQRKLRSYAVIGVGLVALYSLWWQLAGTIFSWDAYLGHLPPESNGFADWLPGLNRLEYLRPWVITKHLADNQGLDFVWVRTNVPAWPLAFAVMAAFSGWLLWQWIVRTPAKVKSITRLYVAGVLSPVVFVLVTGFALHSIYHDDRYRGHNDALFDSLDLLKHEAHSGDVVLLSDTTYHEFYLNYAKDNQVRFVTLPIHPGERGSFEQPLQVVSDDPRDLMSPLALPQIAALAQTQERLWLLMETGPFLPWSIRPVERYMTMYHYLIRELPTDPPAANVRLLEYSTANAPDPFSDVAPENASEIHFGDDIDLGGFTLPEGDTYTSGDVLSVSLYWQADVEVNQDYTIALFIADSTGTNFIQGYDSPPVGGFFPTSTWAANQPVWDNRALSLPASLASGDYQLWVRLYTVADGQLQTLSVSGSEVSGDGDIAILPVTIHIQQP